MTQHVEVQFISESGFVPRYATEGSSGVDLQARHSVVIPPGERRLIPTGLRVSMPVGYEAQVRSRSGLALKNGVCVLNSPGTIDSDYRGEIGVILQNHGNEPFVVEHGMRIAQLVIMELPRVTFTQVESLDDTQRGAGGFGSTGVNAQ